ncbi:unnamed protein product [Prunus armeniaca]|uniref:Uncharacterized protein n=1 Tax=Prunus armeniaca TaxID=36596 RepID=A0A6J5UDC0_PRUAR|nr:unnamed protein product [Prunus armeniaca]CAB4303660.1 unnamed protein product [Prunus armeniaca]
MATFLSTMNTTTVMVMAPVPNLLANTVTTITVANTTSVTKFQPCVPPTPLEENEVDEECVIDKDADELAIELSTQVDLPIEKLTLIERKESTQRDKTQKVVEVEDRNTIQSETAIPRNVDLQSSKRGGWNMNQSYALIIDMVI